MNILGNAGGLYSRVERTADIIMKNDSDMIEQVFAVLSGRLKGADITLFDYKERKVVYSTVFNMDRLEILAEYLSDKDAYPSYLLIGKGGILPSEDDCAAEIMSVPEENMPFVLLCEHKSRKSKRLENHAVLAKLLFIAAGMKKLSVQRARALRLDSSTMLPEREALFEYLQKASGDGGIHSLGLLTITNMRQITHDRGLRYGEQLIKKFSDTLQMAQSGAKARYGQIYRTGQYSFAVLLPVNLYEAGNVFENLMDIIFKTHRELRLSCVVTPLVSDVYRALYICESFSATADTDCVTVVRDPVPDKDIPEYMDVEKTFLVSGVPAAGEPERDETAEQVSTEELKREHEAGLLDITETAGEDPPQEDDGGIFFDFFGEGG